MSRRTLLIIDITVKLALVALLAHAVLWPDLPQYHGKGILSRLISYPLGVLIVPIIWQIWSLLAASKPKFPFAADIMISLPFTIDTLGNALNLFNTIEWWDDLMHFTQWLTLLAGIGILLAQKIDSPWVLGTLIAALGAYTAVAWEIAEYFAFIRHSFELKTAYTDTLGDLGLGTLGATLSGIAIALHSRSQSKELV